MNAKLKSVTVGAIAAASLFASWAPGGVSAFAAEKVVIDEADRIEVRAPEKSPIDQKLELTIGDEVPLDGSENRLFIAIEYKGYKEKLGNDKRITVMQIDGRLSMGKTADGFGIPAYDFTVRPISVDFIADTYEEPHETSTWQNKLGGGKILVTHDIDLGIDQMIRVSAIEGRADAQRECDKACYARARVFLDALGYTYLDYVKHNGEEVKAHGIHAIGAHLEQAFQLFKAKTGSGNREKSFIGRLIAPSARIDWDRFLDYNGSKDVVTMKFWAGLELEMKTRYGNYKAYGRITPTIVEFMEQDNTKSDSYSKIVTELGVSGTF